MGDPAPIALDAELSDFIAGPVAIVVATVGRDGQPHVSRGYAAHATEGGARIHVHVPELCSAAVCADLRAGSGIAVVLSRVEDFRTYQLKGRSAEVAAPSPADASRLEQYLDGFLSELEKIRLSREASSGLRYARFVEVSFALSEAFDQTPGPQAGLPLAGAT
jgi:hypothetical protein